MTARSPQSTDQVGTLSMVLRIMSAPIDVAAFKVGCYRERSRSDMECAMASHKFHVGEIVNLRPVVSRNVPGGAYEVTKHLPHNGREFEYHITRVRVSHQECRRGA